MPTIGITGGLGTGKSTVAELFRERGAIILSADEAARAVLAPGSEALRQVADTFGPDYLRSDGSLDRAKMGAHVFSDPEARRTLESITHPTILRLLREQIDSVRASTPHAFIVVEVPLLYEAGMEDWFDKVVVVAASESAQIRRLTARAGLREEEARRRIAAQMPLEEKIARADIVIRNEGTLAELKTEVDRVWKELQPP